MTHIYIAGTSRIGAAVELLIEQLELPIHVSSGKIGVELPCPSTVLLAVDQQLSPEAVAWTRALRRGGIQVFCVHIEGGTAIIGPAVNHTRSGCLDCWRFRYYNSRPYNLLFASSTSDTGRPVSPYLTPLLEEILAAICLQRLSLAFVEAPAKDVASLPEWGTYNWDLRSLTGRAYELLPDPDCLTCSSTSSSTTRPAALRFAARRKWKGSCDRISSVNSFASALSKSYIHSAGGIINSVVPAWKLNRIAIAHADVWFPGLNHCEISAGFSTTYSQASCVAALEAVERYSSLKPRQNTKVVHGTFSEFAGMAMDPRVFGLTSSSLGTANPERTVKFRDDLAIDWVWAESLSKQQTVLIPRQIGFYSFGQTGEPLFVIDGSGGCALGSCPEEAILHGLLEVIERDSFMLTWLAQLTLPRFNPMECDNIEIRSRCREFSSEGYDIFGIDTTTDFNIPSMTLAIRSNNGTLPYFLCIGAAHHYPERALLKAIRELSAALSQYRLQLKDPQILTRARKLVEDPLTVSTMSDHALLYSLPESAQKSSFLLDGDIRSSLVDMTERAMGLHSPDLTVDLMNICKRITDSGHDVLWVNQTAPELGRLGAVVYKAIIPGSIPMTFGSHNRHGGLPRLQTVLRRFGHGLNEDPHPFP